MAKDLEYIEPEKLVIIGLDTQDGPDHPLYDERVDLEVSQSLVKNIIFRGVQQPVLVRQEAGQLLVVDGRQRVRAAREARKSQDASGSEQLLVPIKFVRADDQTLSGLMVAMNELRESDDVLTKARKASRLLAYGKDIKEVALDFGRTTTTIRNWLKLLEADPAVHVAIQMNTISAAAGIEVAAYPRDEQKEVLERLMRPQRGAPAPADDALPPEAGSDGDGTADGSAKPVSEADVKADKRKARGPSLQKGIRRVWLRKALKSKAAEKLSPEQRSLLEWMATGLSDKGTWYDEFYFEASGEIGED